MPNIPPPGPASTYFARRAVGLGRVFWCVWKDRDAVETGERMACGYAKSVAAAEAEARRSAGPGCVRLAPRFASAALGQAARRGRAGAPAPARAEFLYRPERDEHDGCVRILRHRIVKRTARRIQLERDAFLDPDESTPSPSGVALPTVGINAEELRRVGHARHSKLLGPVFAREDDARRHDDRRGPAPAWCAVLGLPWPCTARDVRETYRLLAKQVHPDHGGDAAQFRALEQAYRLGLAQLGAAVELRRK